MRSHTITFRRVICWLDFQHSANCVQTFGFFFSLSRCDVSFMHWIRSWHIRWDIAFAIVLTPHESVDGIFFLQVNEIRQIINILVSSSLSAKSEKRRKHFWCEFFLPLRVWQHITTWLPLMVQRAKSLDILLLRILAFNIEISGVNNVITLNGYVFQR